MPRTAELVVPGVAAVTGGALLPPPQAVAVVMRRPAKTLRAVVALLSISFSNCQ